jgi:hypothetical protein
LIDEKLLFHLFALRERVRVRVRVKVRVRVRVRVRVKVIFNIMTLIHNNIRNKKQIWK